MLNSWIEENYSLLKDITKKISKTDDVDELFHFCLEQLLKNKKAKVLTSSELVFFFISIVRNNFYSNTSPYALQYKRHNFQELHNIEIPNKEYEEFDELKWVYEQIEKDKKTVDWYYARLFELYIENDTSITNTEKKTTIPRNSVSRDINKYRKILRRRRQKRLDQN